MAKFIAALSLAWLLVLPSWVYSDTNEQVALFEFPGSKMLYILESDASLYRLGLAAQKRINGQWRAEEVELHQGQLQRLTQELPEGFSVDDALALLINHYRVGEQQMMYSCSGRDCGPSNSWANNHFKIKQLYGLDSKQEYRVYDLGEHLLAVYGIQRGNKRVYLHQDLLSKLAH